MLARLQRLVRRRLPPEIDFSYEPTEDDLRLVHEIVEEVRRQPLPEIDFSYEPTEDDLRRAHELLEKHGWHHLIKKT